MDPKESQETISGDGKTIESTEAEVVRVLRGEPEFPNPSPEWTFEERSRVAARLVHDAKEELRAKFYLSGPNGPTEATYRLLERISFVLTMPAWFLEANRRSILK